MLQIFFFLFGALHSVTLLPTFAALSLILVGLLGIRADGVAEARHSKVAWLAIFVLLYLVLNQALHGWTGHLIDLRFYRSQGKPIYMLIMAVILSLMPISILRKGVPWAAMGFAVGVIVSESIFVVVFRALALTPEMTVNLHNVAAAFLAQAVLFVFAAFLVLKGRLHRVVAAGAGICASVLFLVMDSRGLTIALGVGAVTLFYLTRPRVNNMARYFGSRAGGPILLLSILVVGVLLAGKADRWDNLSEDRNVLSRIEIWRHAVHQIHEGLIFGGGLGSVSWVGGEVVDVGFPLLMAKIKGGMAAWNEVGLDLGAAGMHAHNVVLQILAESGLIGMILWLLFLYYAWTRAVGLWMARYRLDPGDVRTWYALTVIGLFMALTTVGMSEGFSLMSPSSAFLLYLLVPLLDKELTLLRRSSGGGRRVASRLAAAS